jgi:TatD DNase family protein
MMMPCDRILPETDGPFGMTNGRPSYPWEAMDVAVSLSELWRKPVPEVRRQLFDNFKCLAAK